jgi:hypothetical protein
MTRNQETNYQKYIIVALTRDVDIRDIITIINTSTLGIAGGSVGVLNLNVLNADMKDMSFLI